MTAYLMLFAAAFLAATLFPAQSEAVLAALLSGGGHPAWALIAATLGNTLGACVNWVLGAYVQRFHDRRWFPVKDESLEKARRWYRRWGRWSLLLSWAPVFGDALTLAAGVMREPFLSFFLITGFAKLMRYLAVAGIFAALW